MRSLLVFAGLVTADAMFEDPMIHPRMKREMLQPRQSLPDLNPSCTSALLGLYNSIPTPPARLVTAIGAESGNPCSATVPSSLRSEYSDYQSSISSWYSGNSDDVSSALSSCPELSSLATLLPVCVTSFLGGGAASGSGTSTGTGTGTASGASSTDTASGASNTGSSSTSSGGSANSQTTDTSTDTAATDTATGASGTATDTDAAPRPTGYAYAAMVAAGALAAAAL